MFAWIAGVVTRALEWTRIVWPSGSDLATALVPTVVPPPGRLSMRMVWPTWADTCSNTVRGTMSVALPGAYGTITRTVFVGQGCAHAGAASASAEQAIAISRASVTRSGAGARYRDPWPSAADAGAVAPSTIAKPSRIVGQER